jgi:hypothetical protein
MSATPAISRELHGHWIDYEIEVIDAMLEVFRFMTVSFPPQKRHVFVFSKTSGKTFPLSVSKNGWKGDLCGRNIYELVGKLFSEVRLGHVRILHANQEV